MFRRHLAMAIRHFASDLPMLAAIWAVATIGVAVVYSVANDEPLTESLALAVAYLPVAVAFSPILWVWRFARTLEWTLPAAAVGIGWFIVTIHWPSGRWRYSPACWASTE